MSYAPKAMLSYADDRGSATVLTEGNVMVTKGLGLGQIMKLADWIILAHGARIVEDYIPLDTMVSQPEAEPKPEPEPLNPLSIGCKLRWTLNQETYRVAIQTAKGVLQVKSVTDGAGECHEDGCTCRPCAELRMVPPPPWRTRRPLKAKLFPDEATWKASLPEGGTIEITGSKESQSKRVAEQVESMSDLEKVQHIQAKYKIGTSIVTGNSPHELMVYFYDLINRNRGYLSNLTLENDLTNPNARSYYSNKLKHAIRLYTQAKMRIESLGQLANVKPLQMFTPSLKKTLYTVIHGERYIVSTFNGKIALGKGGRHSDSVTLFDNFAHMGNPPFQVVYRRKEIPMNW